MTKEEVLNKLNENNIHYIRIDHRAIGTMNELGDIGEQLGCMIPKNLMLTNRQKTRFYLLMMPGDKKFKTKELSHQINSARLSFASDDDMERLLGTHPGSASVLGLLNDANHQVQLLIDEEVLEQEYIGVHPCFNTSTIKVSINDLLNVFLPYVHHDYIKVVLKG